MPPQSSIIRIQAQTAPSIDTMHSLSNKGLCTAALHLVPKLIMHFTALEAQRSAVIP